MRIYLGYDEREQAALQVAADSARSFGHEVIELRTDRLRAQGLFTRPVDDRGGRYDLISGRSQSTDFALTRFWVPLLAHSGVAMYADCDVIFLRDPLLLSKHCQGQRGAAFVVKHPPTLSLRPEKMDGQVQKIYPRKLWSSVTLYNCDHPAHKRLTVDALNGWHRDDLHAFGWLADDEIGSLPPEANWLVGVQPKPADPIIAHYTLGTPDMEGHEHDEYADLWLQRVSQR